MRLPDYKPKCQSRRVQKLCAYVGCAKEFTGRSMQKYCDFHMDPRTRYGRRKRPVPITGYNVTINHAFSEVTLIRRPCDTCTDDYDILLQPRIYVYPGHCERHRTEHRQKNHRRMEAMRA